MKFIAADSKFMGAGTPKNLSLAIHWLSLSAAQGYADAKKT